MHCWGFGGINSGITDNTKNIFLESAYFSPEYVRRTSMHHQLKTDASFRFERGTDPNNTVYALKRAAVLIREIAGGEVASDVIDVYPSKIENRVFRVKYKNIDRLIGKKILHEQIHSILENLVSATPLARAKMISRFHSTYRVDVCRGRYR